MLEPIKKIETECGKEVDIRYFFCCDRSMEGIDIYDSLTGKWIGEMLGVRFPDEDDVESMETITNKLSNFLNDV